MKTVFSNQDIANLYSYGFTFNYVVAHAQAFLDFYRSYSTVTESTTLNDVYMFAQGRQQDAIEYIEKWYTS